MIAGPLPDPGALRAVCLPLPPGLSIDPVALGGDGGVLFGAPWLTLAGTGVAAELVLDAGVDDPASLHAVTAWLDRVPCDDRVGRPGSGVVALAALPFRRGAPGRLTVPNLVYGRDGEGFEWATVVAQTADPRCAEATADQLGAELAARSALPVPGGLAGDPSVEQARLSFDSGAASYLEAVAAAVEAIRGDRLRKVVLARTLGFRFPRRLDAVTVLERLRAQEPTCTAFSFPIDGGRFVGASPELLVGRRGHTVRCHPLAGTAGLSGDTARDDAAVAALRDSVKDQGEHHLVVEELAAALGPRCSELRVPGQPSPVRLRSVAHLATAIEGTLRSVDGVALGILDLLSALHPTAAVGGVPREPALALIEQLEGADRGHWAGPVGWAGSGGDGDFMIGIRSATLIGDEAVVRAGCGVVAASDPAAELAETALKLAPVLDALTPGLAAATLGPSRRRRGPPRG